MWLRLALKSQAKLQTHHLSRRFVHTPRAVQILRKEDENSTTLELDLPALKEVFEHPAVHDKPVCIVTVAGAMRTGKSFLLDQMLNYLRQKHGEGELSSKGFPWRGGMNRYTSGVHIWNEPFIVNDTSDNGMAVFLMDTQGTFDYKSTVKENMTVFALSTMTSSLLMYNLTHVIREDHLQHLQLFTEYGRLALKQSGTIPFQKLQFLVRDWHYPHDAPFGPEGGQIVLDRLLQTTEEQPEEIRKLREHIVSSFTDIDCFLFPYPGPKVAEDPAFLGSQEDMDPRFSSYLNTFISNSLSPENLVAKQIAGKTVKSREMVDYFQKYLEIFNGDEIPEPKSIFDTTAEVTNLHALNEAKEKYLENMGAVKQNTASQAIVDVELIKRHEHCMEDSLQIFSEYSKFGGEALAKHFHDVLVKEILDKFDSLKRLNDSKIQNIFYQAKDGYLTNMESHCNKETPLHQHELADYHIKFAKEATRKFQKVESNESKALSVDMLERLIREIDERFIGYQSSNDAKIRVAVHKAADQALETYSRAMETVLGPLSVHHIQLDYEHKNAKKEAVSQFVGSSNFGTNFVTANENSLIEDIGDKFAYYKELNASRKFTKRLKATVEQLSDNKTYKQFWSNQEQQKILGGSLVAIFALRIIFGS